MRVRVFFIFRFLKPGILSRSLFGKIPRLDNTSQLPLFQPLALGRGYQLGLILHDPSRSFLLKHLGHIRSAESGGTECLSSVNSNSCFAFHFPRRCSTLPHSSWSFHGSRFPSSPRRVDLAPKLVVPFVFVRFGVKTHPAPPFDTELCPPPLFPVPPFKNVRKSHLSLRRSVPFGELIPLECDPPGLSGRRHRFSRR